MYFELNEHTKEILGRPNFACGQIARILREKDGQNIPTKAEAEQAAVIYWLLGFYELHGEAWQEKANAALGEMLKP